MIIGSCEHYKVHISHAPLVITGKLTRKEREALWDLSEQELKAFRGYYEVDGVPIHSTLFHDVQKNEHKIAWLFGSLKIMNQAFKPTRVGVLTRDFKEVVSQSIDREAYHVNDNLRKVIVIRRDETA